MTTTTRPSVIRLLSPAAAGDYIHVEGRERFVLKVKAKLDRNGRFLHVLR